MVEEDEGRRIRRREALVVVVLVGRTVWQIVLVGRWLPVWNSARGSLEQESTALVLPPVIRDVDKTFKGGTQLYSQFKISCTCSIYLISSSANYRAVLCFIWLWPSPHPTLNNAKKTALMIREGFLKNQTRSKWRRLSVM